MPTELVRYPDTSATTLNFFAVGGSGIRTIEPLLHLCAAGLGPREVRLVLIDPDLSNPATRKARNLIELYQRTRALLSQSKAPHSYFRTDVTCALGEDLVWSPVTDDGPSTDMTFGSRMDRAIMREVSPDGNTAGLASLFDLLFAEKYRTMDLSMGFRGVPPIGTVFMNRLRDQPFFQAMLTSAAAQANSVFFAVGSVFGGTGAAALPVIGRALVDGLPQTSDRAAIPGIVPQRVGAALILPFFTLPVADSNTAPDGGPRPQTALFAQNAAAAIPSYVRGDALYGSLYVLGDNEPRPQKANAVGGPLQDNRPDGVELFAAFAALDFAVKGGGANRPAFLYTAVDSGSSAPRKTVSWPDLPLGDESVLRLQGAFIAAHTFLRIFRPDGADEPELARLLKGVTWADRLGMRGRDFDSHAGAFNSLAEYYRTLWRWLGELRQPAPGLELLATVKKPTGVDLDESLDGMRSLRALKDDFEVFRYWNEAAYRRSGHGQASFWEVMRIGSEEFVRDRFAAAFTGES